MTIEQKAKAYDEAISLIKDYNRDEEGFICVKPENIFPELKESKDEKIRNQIINFIEEYGNPIHCEWQKDWIAWLEKQKQDDLTNYKKTLSNYDEAEKEKCDFVGDGFIKCYADFQDFKEGETYWFEYIGDDKYNVRSDNLLGKTYHITPCQLYTIFKKQTWLEKQGEQKLLNNDKYQTVSVEILDRLYESEKELEQLKQREQKPWSEEDENTIKDIIEDLEYAEKKGYVLKNNIFLKEIHWLKSLKPQSHWKQHGTIIHKGNCRFCAERRKQELKELIEELKRK